MVSAMVIGSLLGVGCASAPKVLSPLRPWQKTSAKGFTEKSVEVFNSRIVIRAWPSKTSVVPAAQSIDLVITEINRIAKFADATIEGSEVNQINAKAYKEAVPLFVISSDIETASSAKGHWASWHGMEHVRLFQPITKQSTRLARVESTSKPRRPSLAPVSISTNAAGSRNNQSSLRSAPAEVSPLSPAFTTRIL